ncbi:T9SS type A sorting domain-containing protein [bacterium]|nr:T9SS type A sorting domain-containing protein [bacterium]
MAHGAVQLRLYDILGRQLRTEIDRLSTSGTHYHSVDVTSLAPGTYIAVLTYRENTRDVTFQVLR